MDLNWLFAVEMEPHCVAQAVLKQMTIFLTQPPQCYLYKHESLWLCFEADTLMCPSLAYLRINNLNAYL